MLIYMLDDVRGNMSEFRNRVQLLIDGFNGNESLSSLLRKTKDIAYLNKDYTLCLIIDYELMSISKNNTNNFVDDICNRYLAKWLEIKSEESFNKSVKELTVLFLQRRMIEGRFIDELNLLKNINLSKDSLYGLSIDDIEFNLSETSEILNKYDEIKIEVNLYKSMYFKNLAMKSILIKTRDYYRFYLIELLDKMEFSLIDLILPSQEIYDVITKVCYNNSIPQNHENFIVAIADSIEYLLKLPNGKFFNINSSIREPYSYKDSFISNELITEYRRKIQCFRHKHNSSLNEQTEFSENDKLQFIRMGLIILQFIIEKVSLS